MTLKRTDIFLLRSALASNGGGVNQLRFPDATVNRMMKAGLIQFKPNAKPTALGKLLTITPAGKAALEEEA